MKYEICEKTLSKARLNKYSQACEQDKSKAIWLYQCNMKLSQRFYGVIGLFEVMLRNAINEHYKQQFGDEDWIVNQCAPGCLLADDKEAIEKAYKDFTSKGVYTRWCFFHARLLDIPFYTSQLPCGEENIVVHIPE